MQRVRAAAQTKCNALGGNAVTGCSNMFGEGPRSLPAQTASEVLYNVGLQCKSYIFFNFKCDEVLLGLFLHTRTQVSQFCETKLGPCWWRSSSSRGRCQYEFIFTGHFMVQFNTSHNSQKYALAQVTEMVSEIIALNGA